MKQDYAYRRVYYLSVVLLSSLLICGCADLKGLSDRLSSMNHGAAYGIVTDSKDRPLSDADVFIRGAANFTTKTDEAGRFSVTDIPDGIYLLVVNKTGYRSNEQRLDGFMVYQGGKVNKNISLLKDCDYYTVDGSMDYFIRYGYNGTLYHGDIIISMPYPEGSSYTVSPDMKSGLSEIATVYKAKNRMLRWTVNNSEGIYDSVQAQLYIDVEGRNEVRLFEKKEMKISDASIAHPEYLGKEVFDDQDRRVMIDPTNKEIKALAEQIKEEADSEDVWTVANAIYAWVKKNMVYYTNPDDPEYVQSPIEVLHNSRGDCDELSYLYVSLCRAAGIPARFVTGYWVMNKPNEEYAGHAWAEFYYGEWAPVEMTEFWNALDGTGDQFLIDRDNAMFFGVSRPDHISTFVDDGKSESVTREDTGKERYAKDSQPALFDTYLYYEGKGRDQIFIGDCADGSRKLVKEIE